MSSESDQSDGDYVPGKEEPVSEDGTADEETDLQFQNEVLKKQIKKREGGKLKTHKRKIQRREKITKESSGEEEDSTKANPVDQVAEKQHEDQLWASFLSDTSSARPNSSLNKVSVGDSNKTVTNVTPDGVKTKQTPIKNDKDIENREKKIFEFAGEKVVVDSDSKIIEKSNENTSENAPPRFNKSKPGGGLSNILSQFGKKNKLSTLEKSKLDWENFKSKEGIKDEIHTHNRGKDGYLERQDFLERADVRQFEIEKSLRANKRSHR